MAAICPLCSERPAKRFCPAKEVRICPVCCGIKREIDIDCPGSCVHLKAGWNYESDKRAPDAELAAKVQKYDKQFLYRYSPILNMLSRSVVEEWVNSPWLVDNDVIEVFKALGTTLKTLSSGIYYESLPEGTVRISLFRRLRTVMDELMQPQQSGERRALKMAEAVDIVDFLTVAAHMNSSVRPKSRRYLDWLMSMAGTAQPSNRQSGLILP